MPDTHRARQSLHRVSDLIGIPFRLLRRWEAWKFLSPMTACPHLDALWCFRYPWYLHKWKSHEISSSKRFGRGPSSGALEAWRIKFQMFKPTEPVQHQKNDFGILIRVPLCEFWHPCSSQFHSKLLSDSRSWNAWSQTETPSRHPASGHQSTETQSWNLVHNRIKLHHILSALSGVYC